MSDKRLGHCTRCGTQVFEETLSGGLRPGPHALRVTLAMADGSTADVTFCDTCPVDSTTLPEIHDTIVRALCAECTTRSRPLGPRQQLLYGAMALRQARNVPLGVLVQEPWSEALTREWIHVR